MKAQIWRPRIGCVREKVFGAVQWSAVDEMCSNARSARHYAPQSHIRVSQIRACNSPPQEELI